MKATNRKRFKEMSIGFAVGIIANTLGVLLYILLFSDMGILETYRAAVSQGHVGSLLALGAILNLVAFFGFLAWCTELMITSTPRSPQKIESTVLKWKLPRSQNHW